ESAIRVERVVDPLPGDAALQRAGEVGDDRLAAVGRATRAVAAVRAPAERRLDHALRDVRPLDEVRPVEPPLVADRQAEAHFAEGAVDDAAGGRGPALHLAADLEAERRG